LKPGWVEESTSGDPLGVVHTIARIAFADGGPSRTVVALCRALAADGVRVELVTAEVDGSEIGVPAHTTGLWPGRRRPARGPFARLLEARVAALPTPVVHDHGIWLSSNRAAAAVAARTGVPRIVSPRGMLSGWALAWRGRRKRIAWTAYQRRDLETATALHATSDLELDEIREVGIEVPVAVVPNGVDVPASVPPVPTAAARTRRVLFLSRIHPKKGLENLIEAWRVARPEGWELVIAGPDEGGYRSALERRARGLDPGPAVVFMDEASDRSKWDLYGSADIFVLPTLSENFGVVVAEALASGVPVITTRAAPWELLTDGHCGWWTDVGVEPLAAAIGEAARMGDEERRAMGARGRRLVAERFGWPAIARRMLSVYRWLAGQAGEPDCVRRP
jgi:glycosyltransferase involved in cell wall biosynthesis